MFSVILILIAVTLTLVNVSAFSALGNRALSSRRTGAASLVAEYIPDGLSKEQWKALKKKEADDLAAKGNLGRLGTNRFKSRSFEAWQKSGGKHLFPVDPRTTPYEERPYMQRKNGDWEGKDLASKGYKGKGQGEQGKRLAIDAVYETAKAEGKLDSASILGGIPLPWTSKATEKIGKQSADNVKAGSVKAGRQLSAKQLAAKKARLAKVSNTGKGALGKKTTPAAEPAEEAPKKKRFGFF